MDLVRCVNGHDLPADFHHGPGEEREPCPTCGSRGRALSLTASDAAVGSDSSELTTVTATFQTSWRVYSHNRPDAQTHKLSLKIELERLDTTWLYTVIDSEDAERGSGVADTFEDVALGSALIISELEDG